MKIICSYIVFLCICDILLNLGMIFLGLLPTDHHVSNVNKMAGHDDPALLDRVLPEYRDIFDEIFMDDDSDEFEGFDSDDLADDIEHHDSISDVNWVEGGKVPATFTFTGNSGINSDLLPEDGLSILDYFELLFTADIFETLSVETNRYAGSYLNQHPNLKEHSRFRNWKDTTPMEMRAFLAIIIAMGLVRQLDIQDYWSSDEVIITPFFKTVMPRDRFLLLMSFFHLTDNRTLVRRGQEGYSPLRKLGEPYKQILRNFERAYRPTYNIAIDEGMIPWRGNLHFRVYNPDKPCKYGLKLYMLCDSDNGYCCRVELYTGRENSPEIPSGHGATYDLVMHLIGPYLNKGYHLYVDNYFSSPQLFYDLFMNATLACGTLRTNRRGVPKQLKDKRLVKGETYTMNNSTLVAVKYADKKDVTLLTTIHEGKMVSSENLTRDGTPVQKPDCVLDYNMYMGAVDRCDQMVAYGNFSRRTVKWWKKVFFHLVGVSVLNSYLLYKGRTQTPVQQRVFRRELVKQLVQTAEISGTSSRGRKRQSAEVLQRLTARHFITCLPPTAKREHSRRRCVVCGPAEMELFKTNHPNESLPKRTGRETSFQCKQCNVALCIQPCFELFHTKSEYVLAYKRQKGTPSIEE